MQTGLSGPVSECIVAGKIVTEFVLLNHFLAVGPGHGAQQRIKPQFGQPPAAPFIID